MKLTVLLLATFVATLTFANEQDSTWQVKCQQEDNGREVVCWLVEVPNKKIED